jgi:hypothetical protein
LIERSSSKIASNFRALDQATDQRSVAVRPALQRIRKRRDLRRYRTFGEHAAAGHCAAPLR